MTKEAFSQQVLALNKTMYYISYGLLTNPADQEDAVGEAVCKGLQKCGSLRDEKFFKRWMLRILVNECYNVMRRRKRKIPTETIEIVAPEVPDTSVFDAVTALEPKLRTPVLLHYVEGCSIREIASILRLPEGTIKTRMVKARAILKDMLNEGEDAI